MIIKSIITMLVLLLGVGQAWGQTIAADKLQYCTGALGTPEVTNATNINANEWYVLYIAKGSTKYYIKDGGSSLSLTTTAPTFGQGDGYLFNINSGKILSARTGKYLYGSYTTSWGFTTYSLSTNSANSTTFSVSGTSGVKISCSLNSKTVYLRKNGNNGTTFAFTTDDNNNAWTLVPVTFKKNTTIKFYNGDEEIQNNSNTNPWEMTIGGSEPSLTAKLFWTGNTSQPIADKPFVYGTQPNPSATIDIVSSTGLITPKGAGTAVISATFAGDPVYNSSSATYDLKVNKKSSKLVFDEASYNFTTAQSGTAKVIPSLIWDPDQGGDGSDITGTVTYSSDDETIATVDAGFLTFKKTGQTTIRANFAGNTGATAASASYQLIVSEAGIQYEYRVHVAGGPKDSYDALYGKLIVSGAKDGSVNGEYANGATFDSELLSRSNFTAKDVSAWSGTHTYVANIAVSEVVDGKVDVQVNYAEQFTWTLTINRDAVNNNAAGNGTSSGTSIVVYISGKPYRTTGPFTSTLGVMSQNFISSTNVDGYEYDVVIDNDHHTITVTYRVYTHRSPQHSTFIRLRNAHSSQYITHVSGELSLKTTAKSEDAIIYFEDLADPGNIATKGHGKFLFYKSGRATTAAGLTDIGNEGAEIVFSNEGNTAYFNVTDVNSNLMLEEGTSDGNGGNTLTTSGSDSNLSRWYIEELSALPVTITSAGHGYATLFCPVDLEVPTGVKAYVATERNTGSDGIDFLVTLKRLTNNAIPKNTPVILFSEQAVEQNTTFYFPIVSGVEDISSSLWDGLTGTCPTINRTEGDYALQPTQGSNTVGFYPWTQSTLSPFKAYIPATVSPAKYRFVFDDDDISALDNVAVDAPSLITTRYYNINGVQMAKPLSSGVTIVVDCYSDGTTRSHKIHRK